MMGAMFSGSSTPAAPPPPPAPSGQQGPQPIEQFRSPNPAGDEADTAKFYAQNYTADNVARMTAPRTLLG